MFKAWYSCVLVSEDQHLKHNNTAYAVTSYSMASPTTKLPLVRLSCDQRDRAIRAARPIHKLLVQRRQRSPAERERPRYTSNRGNERGGTEGCGGKVTPLVL